MPQPLAEGQRRTSAGSSTPRALQPERRPRRRLPDRRNLRMKGRRRRRLPPQTAPSRRRRTRTWPAR
eukprot:8854906-Alexandrium_andersonii.AAC.1